MEAKTDRRRRHSRSLKAKVVAACAQPGASVASIALAQGLNANLVHKWRREASKSTIKTLMPQAMGEFIALPMPPSAAPALTTSDIRIELRRGSTAITVAWPTSAAAECAAWLGQWLRTGDAP